MKKVKSILISQPKPEGKSPYATIAKKHKLKIEFHPFMHVDEISAKEFKEQRISILNHDAVIFTSKNAIAPLLSCRFAVKSLIFPMTFALSWKSCTWQLTKLMEIA